MEYRNMTKFPISILSNFSGDVHPELCYSRHIAANILGSLVTILIAIVSIMGNVAVIIASFANENLRVQTGNILMVYLSSLDILSAIFVMLPSAISVAMDYWPLGPTLCKIHAIFNYWFACGSSLDLTVISMDRAIAVNYPLKYNELITKRLLVGMCFFCITLSLFMASICGAPDSTSYEYSEALCAMQYTYIEPGLYSKYVAAVTSCFYIPVVILSICNMTIILAARKSGKSIQKLFVRRNNDNAMNNSMKQVSQNDSNMKKTIKSMVTVVIIYYICFAPYCVGKNLKVELGIDMPPWFNYLSTLFIFASSAVNPFIYAIFRKDYRDAFKKLLKELVRKFA